MMIFDTKSEDETAEIAARVAQSAKGGDVFALSAPMGAGKSAFARGFIKSLCGQDTDVPSPTFTLVQTYDHGTKTIYHFDLYRLDNPHDVINIGWDDALSSNTICLIEWPQKAQEYIPAHATIITIAITGETQRKISIDKP